MDKRAEQPMTVEEWTTLYVLRFGRAQLTKQTFAEGEHEFLLDMEKALGRVDVQALMLRVFKERDREQCRAAKSR